MNFILLAVLSFSLFAQIHSGQFVATEVEPILVWEYVPEHGGNEWVRRGSKPLKTYNVHFQIKSSLTPILSSAKDIDTKFSAEQLIKTFFRPHQGLITHPLSTTFQNGHLNAEWLLVDPKQVNEAFENTAVVNLRELHFSETLIHHPLHLEVCVKSLGCQKIKSEELKAGTVLLRDIKFKTSKRTLTYIYHWSLKDLWETKETLHSPQAIIDL